jgi:ParB family chromosome partitioning protein
MSERVGKKIYYCKCRLLKLDPIIQTEIRDGFISMGHGRAILISKIDAQTGIYQNCKSKFICDTEALLKTTREFKT